MFLKRPADTQELVQNVLSLATQVHLTSVFSSLCIDIRTQDSDNPDLRDRGYIYWRLLSTDPGAAKVGQSLSLSSLYLSSLYVGSGIG